jgi:Domain of unknown function (DUF4345)
MRNTVIQNLHFYISIPIVIVVALIYGFQPNLLFDIQPNSVDEHNVYKAIMGIYLAFAFFWSLALVQKQYWKAATISNILFMLGLALGRLISFAVDGIPSSLLFLGCFGELIIAFYGYYLLKKTN